MSGTPAETTPWGVVGDRVALMSDPGFDLPHVMFHTITKITATQIVVDMDGHERRFRRDDGRERGDRQGLRLHRVEDRRVQDIVAARAVRDAFSNPDKTIRQVRSRDGALQALHQMNRLVHEVADKLGVNHADLV